MDDSKHGGQTYPEFQRRAAESAVAADGQAYPATAKNPAEGEVHA